MGDDPSYRIFTILEKWKEEDKREETKGSSKVKKKKKPRYESKQDEYESQKPCCRSNGKRGH